MDRLKGGVKAIDDAAGFLRGECRELYVPTVALELEHLANSLRADPPKRKALLRLLEPLCAMGEVTILTRDTAGAEMVRRVYRRQRAVQRSGSRPAVRWSRRRGFVSERDPVRHGSLVRTPRVFLGPSARRTRASLCRWRRRIPWRCDGSRTGGPHGRAETAILNVAFTGGRESIVLGSSTRCRNGC